MAKGKGKGKEKKGKKKAEIDPNALTEVDKTFYELQIADLNRKLARLRTLTQELEDKNEELKQSNEKLDEDRSDIIIYLKRMLQEKIDEIKELEERVTALQESMQNTTEDFEEKIAEMEQEYKQMHEQLTSEIKLLEGKLNSLEEFRTQRDDLLKKFENQENEMEAQEKRHKRELYEIERKFIISKDQLKKDMEAEVITTFHSNASIKKRDITIKQQIIERLTDDHKFMSDLLDRYRRYQKEVFNSRNDIKAINDKNKQLEYKNKILEQNLHHIRCERTATQADLIYTKEENGRLNAILIEAVSCIKDALTVRTESEESLRSAKRENFLNSLFALLSKAKDEKIRRPSLDTIDSMEATYTRGDLGFIPKPVELRSKIPTKRHMDSQTGISFDEYLMYVETTQSRKSYSVEGEEQSIPDSHIVVHEGKPSVLFFDESEIVEEESEASNKIDIFGVEEEEDQPSGVVTPLEASPSEAPTVEGESPGAQSEGDNPESP
ncbi:hypothetical protein NQ314_017501 [Rhamnusium bicolor]|uniref:Cilia- and flagella-associated protein 157 n=1 Tax=Rhamnusium bicolor TaxID=1586634 RepID=A0AAV8WT68_9CUCU|nr:hypothetical protein NQ314_017501 [Rhamnusium bicolor]